MILNFSLAVNYTFISLKNHHLKLPVTLHN